MFKTLKSLGFKKTDVKVYIFLTTQGLQKATDIAEALNLSRKQLYRILKNLQKQGIINASTEKPDCFSAVPFENVLELFIEVKMDQQRVLQESREELLFAWHSIIKKNERPKS